MRLRTALYATQQARIEFSKSGIPLKIPRSRWTGLVFVGNPAARITWAGKQPVWEKYNEAELYIIEPERSWARSFIANHTWVDNAGKPLICIYPWLPAHGSPHHPRSLPYPVSWWDALVKKHSAWARFWQIGWEGDTSVQGCEYYFVGPRRISHIRRSMALIERADAVISVTESPSLIARALGRRCFDVAGPVPKPPPVHPIEEFLTQVRRETMPY